MKQGKKIIQELILGGHKAHYYKDTARDIRLRRPAGNNIYIATSASLAKIRKMCKNLGLSCEIKHKINKMTLELIVDNKYIVAPYIVTTLKNNYATRKYSRNPVDMLNSQGFTINGSMCDIVGGHLRSWTYHPKTQLDSANKLINMIGDPHKKITENRMFLLEAGILLADLGSEWSVEYNTFEAISRRALEIAVVSAEAIKESMIYLMRETEKPSLAFRFYKNSGILQELVPELLRGIDLAQSNKANNLDLFNHIMYALDSVDKSKPNYEALRWACIFHDIAKPYTKSYDTKGNIHFYGHDKIGAIFAIRWLEKYKFEKQLINKVSTLCRHHLFDASLRLDKEALNRLIKRVGKDHIMDLLNLREADRWGTGRKNISMKKINILKNKVRKILKYS